MSKTLALTLKWWLGEIENRGVLDCLTSGVSCVRFGWEHK
jgi:hypothetical protein